MERERRQAEFEARVAAREAESQSKGANARQREVRRGRLGVKNQKGQPVLKGLIMNTYDKLLKMTGGAGSGAADSVRSMQIAKSVAGSKQHRR